MKTTMKLCKSSFGRLIAFILCFVMTFTFIPFIDSEGTTANAETPTIQLGDYVQMGTYYGDPILWRCVAFYPVDDNGTIELTNPKTEYQEGYLPLMLSDKILCLKAFDASGTVTTNSSHGRGYTYNKNKGYYRQQYGSNYWGDSNIRCWLNSTASAGNVEWTCGNKPDKSHVYGEYNAYDKEAGFLTNFTQSEINCMKEVNQYTILDRNEGIIGEDVRGSLYEPEYYYYDEIQECGYYNTVVKNFVDLYSEKIKDTMFILDLNQYLTLKANCDDEAVSLEKNYYVGKLSSGCVEKTDYSYYKTESDEMNKIKSKPEEGQAWSYWLRSPNYESGDATGDSYSYENYACSYREYLKGAVLSEGNQANYTGFGIRPAFYLDFSSAAVVYGDGSEDIPYSLVPGPNVTVNFEKEQTNQIIDSTILYKKQGEEAWIFGTDTEITLEPNATYYFKYAEASGATTVIAIPNRPATPSAPTVKRQTDTTVTLSPTAGYEYKCGDGNWQDSNVFKGLEAGQSYTFYQRVKATDRSFRSETSAGKEVDIKYAAPTVSYRTFTSITLKSIDGYVYKCDNGDWTDNNEFTGLEKGKTYTFYQKKKGTTDEKYTSEPLEIRTLTNGDVITSAVGITGVTAYLAVIAKNKLISKWFLTSNGIFGKKVN